MDKRFLLLAGAAIFATAALGQNYPTYIKLASVDAGRIVAESSPEAKRAKRAWDRASALCIAPNGLDNQVATARNELLAKQIATSNVEILEGLAGVLFQANKKPECASLLGMYATVRQNNDPTMNTHTDVVLAMRSLAKMGMLGFQVTDKPPSK